MTSQLTPEQQAVVDTPVGNILVSAAAGSGKTRVLTDRIVQRIIAGQTDVRSILVMTFTDMAARQMRDKIAEKLRTALTVTTDEATIAILRRQLLLLPGALISTIHSFCLTVIRNFYYEAKGADGEPLVLPDFSIDDGSECDSLLRDALDTLLEECHEAIDLAGPDLASLGLPEELVPHLPADLQGNGFSEAFYRLVDGYGSARDDEPVKALILTLYKYLRSMPDYADFVREKITDYSQSTSDFAHSPSAKVLLVQLKLRLDRAMLVLPELESMLGTVRFLADRQKNAALTDGFREAFSILRSLHTGLADGSMDYDEVYRISRPLSTVSAPRGGKSDTPEKQVFTELFCQYVAEAVYTAAGGASQTKCKEVFQFDPLIAFERSSTIIETELQHMLPAIRCLFALVLAVDSRYSAEKKQAGLIEFSDFEHLALAILRSREAGAYYRSRISEIYIDEYQDTSSIQEAIIASITNRNCLMVGDVKQSIYRFRHARPQIFLDKHAAFATGDGGALFELNRNFRSQQGIVDVVNQWFAQLMSEAAGEIRYDDRHALIAGAAPDSDGQTAVRLLFLDLAEQVGGPDGSTDDDADAEAAGPTEAEDPEQATGNDDAPGSDATASDAGGEGDTLADRNRYQKEALMVAAEIQLLAAHGTDWKDIAILTRTRQILNLYADVLSEKGIPILEEAEQAFLDTPTLRLMEALVHLLDNRRQDIPLAAVMRSTLFAGGFTDDELARIRLASRLSGLKHVYYHEAVDWYAVSGEDAGLKARVAGFLGFLDDMREKEPVFSISELLDLIFQQTGFRDRTARLSDGLERVADLDRFSGFAEQFEKRSRRGIYGFARHIERLHELGKQQPAPSGEQSEQNAVRLITMHRSKGLEFPIVFIVGTAYKLDIREKNQHLLLSEQLGIGPDFADPDRQVVYPTPLKQAMFEALKAKNRSEELRLLYVAMTRAMKVLYLTGCFKAGSAGDKNAMRLINSARAMTGPTLPEHLVLAAHSYQEWLLLALARNDRIDLSPLFGQTPEEPVRESLPDSIPIPITFQTLAGIGNPSDARPGTAEPTGEPLSAELAEPGFSSALLLAEPLPEGIAVPELAEAERLAIRQHIETVILGAYPYPDSVRLPQKLSVSELKRRAGQLAVADESSADAGSVHGITQSVSEWPQPSQPERMTASEIGTAAHQTFRFLDLSALVQNPTPAEMERQLDRLQMHGILTEDAVHEIRPLIGAYCAFFKSPVAARLLQAEQRGQLYREMPFTIAVPAAEISRDRVGVAPDDRLLVQGMIDLWFRDGAQAVLIDFKTDRLNGTPAEREEMLRSRYQVQVDYYARAISRATGLPVTERLLYSVQDARFISLPPAAASLDTDTRP